MQIENLTEEERLQVQKIEMNALLEVDRICTEHLITYTLGFGTMLGAIRHDGFIPWDDDVDVCMLREDYNRFCEVCASELSEPYFYQSHDTDPEYYHLFNKIRVKGTLFKETFLSPYSINHGVYIDIFPIDNLADPPARRALQYRQFYIIRTALMAKYLNINARHGLKKMFMRFVRVLFFWASLDWLYKKATEIAQSYNDRETKLAHYFGSVQRKGSIFERDWYLETKRIPFEGHMLPVPVKAEAMLKSLYGDYMSLPAEQDRITRHDLEELELF